MEQKTKRVIVILSVLVLALLVGAYLYGNKLKKDGEKNQNQNQIEQKQSTSVPKTEIELQQQMADIIATKNDAGCQKIEDEVYRKACVNNIALNLAQEDNDIGQCQKVDGELLTVADCERQILVSESLGKNDSEVCKKTQDIDLRKECLNNYVQALAIKENDPAKCQTLEGEEVQNSCNDYVVFENRLKKEKEGIDCGLFKGVETKQDCLLLKEQSAKSENFRAICGQMKTMIFKSLCR